MAITTRDLDADDAQHLAGLMARIEADHPTGFCLGPGEVREVMGGKAENVFEGAFDGDDLVAYVLAHEYVVPPSGGPGPEIHVP